MGTTSHMPGISITDVVVERPSGDRIVLGSVIDVPTIVILARYYG